MEKKGGMKLGEQTQVTQSIPTAGMNPPARPNHIGNTSIGVFFLDLGLCSSFPGGFAGAQNVVVVPKSCPVAAPARGDAKRTSTGIERDKIK